MEQPEPLSVHGGLGRRRATITAIRTEFGRGSRQRHFFCILDWIDMFGTLGRSKHASKSTSMDQCFFQTIDTCQQQYNFSVSFCNVSMAVPSPPKT